MSTSNNSSNISSSSLPLQKPLNMPQENLHCHHLLFNKDVTESVYNKENDSFQSKKLNINFRRAKLNGIIVAQDTLLSNISNEKEYNIWLDDGTSAIRVIIPNQVLKRVDAEYLVTPYNVTLFGKVEFINHKHVIRCGGYRIEDNDASEMYHWIRTLQERPKNTDIPHNSRFSTLSSLPSPNRLQKETFLESPIKEGNNSNRFAWSPDHAFATSTPIRAVQVSPLRQRVDRFVSTTVRPAFKEAPEEFSDDDEFEDFGSSVDLIALEQEALQTQKSNKRKIDMIME